MAVHSLHRKHRRRRFLGADFVALPGDNRAVTRIVQPKLRVSHKDDSQEREADAVADRMMGPGGVLEMSAGEAAVQRQCAECEQEDEETQRLQRKAQPEAEEDREDKEEDERLDTKRHAGTGEAQMVGDNLTQRIQRRRGQGRPLLPSEQAFFEPRFGRRFSRVRLHTDPEAQQLSESINARAFTLGQDIFFNRGEYRPGQPESRHLMAHELTHTLQQSGARTALLQREEKGQGQSGDKPYSYGPDGFRFEPFGETCERQEVSDTAVRQHILESLERNGDDPGSAFSSLRGERERNCCDVDLAAAEHYMWARAEVQSGETSYASMVTQISIYGVGKAVTPDPLIPRTGNCPPTPVSQAQVEWALAGASAGRKRREE